MSWFLVCHVIFSLAFLFCFAELFLEKLKISHSLISSPMQSSIPPIFLRNLHIILVRSVLCVYDYDHVNFIQSSAALLFALCGVLFYFTFSNIFITDLYLNFLLIFKLSFWYIFEHMSYAIDFVFWKILYWIFLNFSTMDLFLLRVIASLSSEGLISPLFWEFYYLIWVEFPFQNLIFYFLFCLLILEEHFPRQLPETQCVG